LLNQFKNKFLFFSAARSNFGPNVSCSPTCFLGKISAPAQFTPQPTWPFQPNSACSPLSSTYGQHAATAALCNSGRQLTCCTASASSPGPAPPAPLPLVLFQCTKPSKPKNIQSHHRSSFPFLPDRSVHCIGPINCAFELDQLSPLLFCSTTRSIRVRSTPPSSSYHHRLSSSSPAISHRSPAIFYP
jgi:hypothetical protein